MNFEEISEEEIVNIATPIINNYMDASTKMDHKKHVRDFTDRLKSIVTEEHLKTVCERYQKEKGYFAERKLVKVFVVLIPLLLFGHKHSPKSVVNIS
jgi:hypothetical protein